MFITEPKVFTEFHIQGIGIAVRSAGALFIRIDLYIPSCGLIANECIGKRFRNLLAIYLYRE